MQHLEEGTIHAYIDRALSPAEAHEVEAHLATCKVCEGRVALAHGLIAASSRIVSHLDVVPRGVIPAAKAKTSRWISSAWPTAIAATLVIGIGLVSIRGKGNPDLPVPQATPAVIRPTATDSMPVVPTQPEVGPQRNPPAGRNAAKKPVAGPDVVQLPPPNVAIQKSTVEAAPPTAAPRPRSDVALSEVVVSSAPRGRSLGSAGGIAVGGSAAAASAATAPPPAAAADSRQVAEPLARVDSVPAFVGCYERVGVTESSPVTRAPRQRVVPRTSSQPAQALPPSGYAAEERYDRFALMDEAAPTPGQLAVRILDAAGRPEGMIYGAGWSVHGDRAIVRNSQGQIVVTLVKSDSGVHAASVRVISCRK